MTSAALKMKPAELFTLIKESALAFGQDKAPRLAAALSYYAMSSLAPLLLFAVAVAGFFLSDSTVVERLFGPEGSVAQSIGQDTADFLRKLVSNQEGIRRGSIVATIVAFVITFMGATGLFVQLQDALNSMWGADPVPPQGLKNVIKTRLISFVLILGIGLILLVFLGLNTWLSALAHQLGDRIGVGAVLVRLGTFALSAFLLTFVFAAIFKVLPAVKLQWREVMVGGAITAILFSIGQILISIYFGRAAPGSAFGAAGTLVALLAWIYYSAMIFFFGAEVTWVYSQKFGSHAGGAGNTAKKQALAQKGANISTEPSGQEQEAAAAAGGPVRDSRGRVIDLPNLPRVLPVAPTRAEGRTLPTVRGTLWNAVSALLAIPAVVVLRVLGLTGGKKKSRPQTGR
ncbi:YihY/virulence factor BrkB family protein [Deinococcus cavernae]|nr:YihY/virulence factor BrkB family protein [Deinococcus cavernae]